MYLEKSLLILAISASCLISRLCFSQNIQSNVQKELKVWKLPNLREAAEAYFSPDGKFLICNAKMPTDSNYQVYLVSTDGSTIKRINDKGDDACSYFSPDGEKIIFTSTRDNLDLPKGSYSDAKIYPQGSEIYSCDFDGKNLKRLTKNNYYDAECTYSPDGKWILFSRQINGKLDLWKMLPDGSNQTQITHTDSLQEGGAFYLSDNKKIIYRAWKIADQSKKPMPMKLYIVNDDGNNKVLTDNDGTNWSPFPAPDGIHYVYVKVLQTTTPEGKPGRPNFEIFLGNLITGEQKQLTFSPGFEGFPVLSPDGKTLNFSSDRDVVMVHGAPKKLFIHFMDVSSLNLGKK